MGSVDNSDAALIVAASDWQAAVAAADQEERLRFRWVLTLLAGALKPDVGARGTQLQCGHLLSWQQHHAPVHMPSSAL